MSPPSDPNPRQATLSLPQLTGPHAGGDACADRVSHVYPPDRLRGDDGDATPRAGRVYLETFGCQMNVLDSELMTGQLRSLGYGFVDDWKSADVVLYNTCSVRERAEQKVWSRVGRVGLHKRDERPDLVLGVVGCMAERDGEAMLTKYPQIDLLCGPGELDKLPMLIDNVRKTALPRRGGKRSARANGAVALQGNTHRRSATLDAAADALEYLDLSRSFDPYATVTNGSGDGPERDDAQTTTQAATAARRRSAYVRITRGCNKFCSYCVVPNTRGREVHRAPGNILEECRRLVEAGVREITLLGQTVNHYHYDAAAAQRDARGVLMPQIGATVKNVGTGFDARGLTLADNAGRRRDDVVTFAELLATIHDELPDLRRLRFVTSFPRDFGDDILDVIAARPRICNYFHLPAQSGSDRLLSTMNRGHTVAEYRELIERIRAKLAGQEFELASDFIVGFCGEREEDFEATAALIRWARFKNSFIFKYSPRPGTAAFDAAQRDPAGRFADDVPEAVKRRRNNALLTVQAEVSRAVHQGYVGRTVEVFVEALSDKAHLDAPEDQAADRPRGVQLTGRTQGDLIVVFAFEGDRAQARRLIGGFAQVQIERAAPLTLFGRLIAVEESLSFSP